MPLSWNEIKDRSLRFSRRRVANFKRKVALEAECSGWTSSTQSPARVVHRADADRSPLDPEQTTRPL